MKTLADNMKKNIEQENYPEANIIQMLKEDKKIVTFVGTSKSGTSFIINNLAELLANNGVNVAILDATQNKNDYYIYTNNEEKLRKIATESIEGLANGIANGIETKENLTVYTGVPGADNKIEKVEKILETLLKKHSIVLVDCDFKTPSNYFKYATENFLIQTMDVLTIQPLTEMLLDLTNKGVLNNSKLRIIINKYVNLADITEKEIIGGMSYYNDPSMSYMKELFNRNFVKYIVIPFEKEISEKYLEDIAKCQIDLEGYSNSFKTLLKQLSEEIYPINNN